MFLGEERYNGFMNRFTNGVMSSLIEMNAINR